MAFSITILKAICAEVGWVWLARLIRSMERTAPEILITYPTLTLTPICMSGAVLIQPIKERQDSFKWRRPIYVKDTWLSFHQWIWNVCSINWCSTLVKVNWVINCVLPPGRHGNRLPRQCGDAIPTLLASMSSQKTPWAGLLCASVEQCRIWLCVAKETKIDVEVSEQSPIQCPVVFMLKEMKHVE